VNSDVKKFLWISVVFLIFGGVGALIAVWSAAAQVFWAFFPIFGKKAVENYLTSPYFRKHHFSHCIGFWNMDR